MRHGSARCFRGSRRPVVTWRRAASAVGLVVFLASMALLFERLRQLTAGAIAQDLGREDLLRLLLGTLPIYLVALACFHGGWAWLVCASMDPMTRDRRRAVAVSARAQIAKYFPGNVAHIAGRQYLVGRLGWPQAPAASATLLEILGLPILAGLIVLVGAPFGGYALSDLAVPWVVVAGLAVAAASLAAVSIVMWKSNRFERPRQVVLSSRHAIAPAAGCYAAFLLLGAFAQAVLLPELSMVKTVLASMIAWLVGYLTPGVPAGLGVREAAFVLVLDLDAGAVAAAVVGCRIVMIVADLIMLGAGIVVERHCRMRVQRAGASPDHAVRHYDAGR